MQPSLSFLRRISLNKSLLPLICKRVSFLKNYLTTDSFLFKTEVKVFETKIKFLRPLIILRIYRSSGKCFIGEGGKEECKGFPSFFLLFGLHYSSKGFVYSSHYKIFNSTRAHIKHETCIRILYCLLNRSGLFIYLFIYIQFYATFNNKKKLFIL